MNALEPQTFERATFERREEYEHFSNPKHEACFACNSQKMLVRPIRVTERFVLLPATTRIDDSFMVMPGCWLVYPRAHVTSLEQLPDNWTADIKHAVRILELKQPYCTSENWGRGAGQTVQHAHTWIVKRGDGEAGLLSEDTGLATILQRIRQDAIPKL